MDNKYTEKGQNLSPIENPSRRLGAIEGPKARPVLYISLIIDFHYYLFLQKIIDWFLLIRKHDHWFSSDLKRQWERVRGVHHDGAGIEFMVASSASDLSLHVLRHRNRHIYRRFSPRRRLVFSHTLRYTSSESSAGDFLPDFAYMLKISGEYI